MNTVQTWQTVSFSLENTLAIASAVGSNLRGGELLELVSDLGGGKTAFVRGLARGMGSSDVVHSPSFTLSNQYTAADLKLYHFDFYRLQEAGLMRDELAEVIDEPLAVVAVEWANIVEDVLPATKLTVSIQAIGESKRAITIDYPAELSYVMAGL